MTVLTDLKFATIVNDFVSRADEQSWCELPGRLRLQQADAVRQIPYREEALAEWARTLVQRTHDPILIELFEIVLVLERSKHVGAVYEPVVTDENGRVWLAVGTLARLDTPQPSRRHSLANCWRKLFGRLAEAHQTATTGASDQKSDISPSFTRRLATKEDGGAWISTALVLDGGAEEPGPASMVLPSDSGPRRNIFPAASAEVFVTTASRRASQGCTATVAWGWLGASEPVNSFSKRLPRDRDGARRQARALIANVGRAVRPHIRNRQQLDSYLPNFVAYLLRHGHGDLPGNSWSAAGKAFDEMLKKAPKSQTLRNQVRAAEKRAHGWRRIGQP